MKDNGTVLEFDQIKEMLCGYACTDAAREKLAALSPFLEESRVRNALHDTTEARLVLDSMGSPPLSSLQKLRPILTVAEKGGMLSPEQLTGVLHFAAACRKLIAYLKKAEITGAQIAGYGASIDPLTFLSEEIDRCIQGQEVDSNATKELRELRRKMENASLRIKSQLEEILKKKKEYCSDGFISMRGGHFTIPVKKEYRHQVSGMVIDTSSTGATCFIEPSAVIRLRDDLSALKGEESVEVSKILYTLTSLVDDCRREILINIEAIETLDFLFAKGKLSAQMKAVPPDINTKRRFSVRAARHPLLRQEDCVPLDFSFGEGVSGVIITGPNTGGKTVTLKTLGLFSLMAQSGLHLPCEQADICLNGAVLCDIGDGQSITENLSTFSAHVTNILAILRETNRESLVLLDELGSGTDPAEGMGIAVAVLEELKKRGCLFVATTHYPEVKEYARDASGIVNARMTFDRENLRPLYRLEIGEAGESCALYIAKRLGFPPAMLERAARAAYGERRSCSLPEHTPALPEAFQAETAPETAQPAASTTLPPSQGQHVVTKKEPSPKAGRAQRFQVGDSVVVYPKKQLGIVCRTANERGEIMVQIQKVKKLIGHKHLQLKTPADQLYPEDYDFSIVFDSVEHRKARRKMEKRHLPGVEIPLE